MSRLGLDVEQMNQLVRTLRQEADKLEQTVTAVNARVRGTWWEGPDASRFRDREWPEHQRALRTAMQSLKQAADGAERQRTEQQTASR